MIVMRWMNPDSEWLSNSYLVTRADGGDALVVDTGVDTAPLLAEVRARRLRVRAVVNTHHHIDHTQDNARVAKATGAAVLAHAHEAPLIENARGVPDGETLELDGWRAVVRHIPGHTAGHLALHVTEAAGETGHLFTGDTLFRRSVGGTRAPGHTTLDDLRRSILETLLAHDDATIVHPGHTEPTTIGEERRENPFIRAWLGVDRPGDAPCRFAGRPARLLVWARDYDGGWKAWIRFETGEEAVVPGSRVER